MPKDTLTDWELVLSAAARLQRFIPHAVLVGGTASALFAKHRFSKDADHVITDLRDRFDTILADLESVSGWQTSRVQKPVQILGSLDGIETGVRQLIRKTPLETTQIDFHGEKITIPTRPEILRIKSVLILKRNATRDYLDLVALADHMENSEIVKAMAPFDTLYPQPNGESALQQLQIQLSNPMPYDLEEDSLAEYKNLDPKWHQWETVKSACINISILLLDEMV
jgi:Nucleotidyl transferase AbiEii toxin, Type IV TA system